MQKKSFNAPDDSQTLPKAKFEIVKLGKGTIVRSTFEPGWKWSTDIKPAAGTPSCTMHHVMYVISGQLKVVMDDGAEFEISPGDIADIPPGHDGWVVGKEPVVAIDMAGISS